MDLYEQKYNDTLDLARTFYEGYIIQGHNGEAGILAEIFPELAQSEDEKTRKAILELVKQSSEILSKQNQNNMITWLEKQGEQKPNDNVEPKFKVKDWVILNDIVAQILDKQKYGFVGLDTNGKDFFCNYGHTDSMHLWTINDAKDGDVLSFYLEYKGNKMVQTGIIEKYVDKHGDCSNTFKVYVGVNWENNFQIGDYMGCSDIRPATKEQRDLLFKEIHDAGYAWDAEKKELKKIIEGAMWADSHHANLWKDAQGDELPKYDREVVVLIQDYPDDKEHLRVAFGHRPNPNGCVTIDTMDGEKLYPMTYDEGGWNVKNVRYWLDVKLPNQPELQ